MIMKKKIVTMILVMAVSATAMVGCGSKQNGSQAPQESTAAQESTELHPQSAELWMRLRVLCLL